MTENSAFVPIRYLITWMDKGVLGSRGVDGFAFEIPGWPEFHCCVRWGNRISAESLFNNWIVDHYETGAAISAAGHFEKREDVPLAMKGFLDRKGKEDIHKIMTFYGLEIA